MLAGRWGAAQLLSRFSALPSDLTSLFPTRQKGCWRKRPTPHSCALKVGAGIPETGTVLPLGLYMCTELGDQREAVWSVNNSRTIWGCMGRGKSGILELLWADKALQLYPVLQAPGSTKLLPNHITVTHQWVA